MDLLAFVLEWIIKYVFLLVIIALGILLVAMVLLYGRDRVREFLKIPFLQEQFEKLCDLSDRLDEPHKAQNPYGTAMWVPSLIWKGVMAAAGLMVLWILVSLIRG